MSTLLPVATGRQAARFVGRLLSRRRGPLLACGVAFLVAGICGLVPAWLLGDLVDRITDGDAESAVLPVALGIAISAVIGGICTWLAMWALSAATEPALAVVREDVFGGAVELDSERLERAGSGDLLSRVGDDVRSVTEALDEVVPLLIQAGTTVLLTVIGMAALDWRLALAGLVPAPFYVAGLRWYLPRSGPYYARQRIAQGTRAQTMVDGVQAAPTLRSYSWQDDQLGLIAAASDRVRVITIEVFHLLTRYFGRNNRAEFIGLAAILATGFFLVRADEVSVGAVTAAALLFHRLFNPVGILLTLFDALQSAGAALARLAGVALMPTPQPPTEPLAEAGTGLRMRQVHFRYDEDHPPAVQDVDLDVAPHEHLAVVGATGAGKTTLGMLVSGSMPVTTGTVLLHGQDVRRRDMRRLVVAVSQEVHVFAASVRDNLTLAAPSADETDLTRALEQVGAHRWVRALPDRLDTLVGEHGHPLTAAQAQQLALARVALSPAHLVVLDEATAEAGSQGAQELEQAVVEVIRGRSALIVAHRLGQAARADRVVVMEQGRIVEVGGHDELVAAGGRYAQLWRAWSAPGGPG